MQKVLIFIALEWHIAWKVSKYGVISGPYFLVFGPAITLYLDSFHPVIVYKTVSLSGWYFLKNNSLFIYNINIKQIIKTMLNTKNLQCILSLTNKISFFKHSSQRRPSKISKMERALQ